MVEEILFLIECTCEEKNYRLLPDPNWFGWPRYAIFIQTFPTVHILLPWLQDCIKNDFKYTYYIGWYSPAEPILWICRWRWWCGQVLIWLWQRYWSTRYGFVDWFLLFRHWLWSGCDRYSLEYPVSSVYQW